MFATGLKAAPLPSAGEEDMPPAPHCAPGARLTPTVSRLSSWPGPQTPHLKGSSGRWWGLGCQFVLLCAPVCVYVCVCLGVDLCLHACVSGSMSSVCTCACVYVFV